MPPGVEYDVKKTIKRKLLSMYFVRGWWTDKDDCSIKEAGIGGTIRFHIETEHVDDGDEIIFTVYDSDGVEFLDDRLSLTVQGTTTAYNKVKIIGNKGFIEWTTGEGSLVLLQENFEGDELELYVKCEYKGNIVNLPHDSDDYLMLYEKEVLITVLIELPHSSYTLLNNPLSALGLAGHSAMAIGDRYFDYGPDYAQTIVSEKRYDYDFNEDGDKDDNIDLTALDKDGQPVYTINEKFAPGRPWWGESIAERKKIKAEEVTLKMALEHIAFPWNGIKDSNGNYIVRPTNIYGEVHKVEFYVKEREAKKMIEWWEERYEHLKVYSVWPWAGEQCTTAVKTAIQQAFPFNITKPLMSNYIPDTTQMPSGLLEDLKSFISTSRQHSNQFAKQNIIKNESKNFP
ncbi:hypothetical protein HX13_10040 [Chryseobacterium sp. P1-3]|uniref:hypothetical protein n=1 Tax=Chryseobacterium sp. (strain P1-3) TaxID=1517683 RepID=UPI0004E676F8|nr:hypothetical protein [Chryseobacterium sp. P1-3]KFF74477.1 hypothetical protein HX13_10040 [Chryseobacterium sp. P1-3]